MREQKFYIVPRHFLNIPKTGKNKKSKHFYHLFESDILIVSKICHYKCQYSTDMKGTLENLWIFKSQGCVQLGGQRVGMPGMDSGDEHLLAYKEAQNRLWNMIISWPCVSDVPVKLPPIRLPCKSGTTKSDWVWKVDVLSNLTKSLFRLHYCKNVYTCNWELLVNPNYDCNSYYKICLSE